MRPPSLALGSALAAGAMAQSTSVTSLFLYGFEGKDIVASVLSAAPQETTYSINCAPGTDGSDCGFGPGVTAVVDGQSVIALHVTEVDAFTMDAECHITSETEADCTQTIAGPEANDPGVAMAVTNCPDCVLPVTITAGLEKILAAGTAKPTGSTASGPSRPSETGASGSSSATGTGASGSAAVSTSAATSASASNSTGSNGAVAGAGQNLVLVGLSGIFGLVMAL